MSANESRRRTEPVSTQETDSKTAATRFTYQPLDPKVDCTRFVKIQPAMHDDDPIACSLIHRPFGERPNFEALSYMWGDATARESIQLDGCDFDVGKNLFGALRFLRNTHKPTKGDLFWIDALCINQNDTDERNRQVRMMGQIYFRATQVIIWLGNKYLKYQNGLIARHDLGTSTLEGTKSLNTTLAECPQSQATDMGNAMWQELAADEYWSRLWIIQEVGQNETKKVCFGIMALPWEYFIHTITMHSSINAARPQRLDRHVKEKYAGSHTLRRLLEDHKEAQCKDRKDKIYGLVGLAADGHGFPIDYEKSEMEIWTDTMEFLNRRGLFEVQRNDDIVACGALVKFLLMGPNSSPLQQVWRSYKPKADPLLITETFARNSTNFKVFQVEAHILGVIYAVGPSTRDIVSSISKSEQWAEMMQENFRETIGEAYEENNRLMRAILALQDDALAAMCFNHAGLVRWRAFNVVSYNQKPLSTLYSARFTDGEPGAGVYLPSSQEAQQSELSREGGFNGDAYLYQLCDEGENTHYKMGIASGQALAGDLVCLIRGIRRAIVLRMFKGQSHYDGYMLRVCGTALVGEDVAGVQTDSRSRCDKIMHTTVKLDARTIFVLLD